MSVTITRTGDWGGFERMLKNMNALAQKNMTLATKEAAVHLRDKIKLTIVNQRSEWPELEPETIRRKGSSKKLIDEGDLLGGVQSMPIAPMEFFIGIARAARNSEGNDLVQIGAVHEFGSRDGNTPQRSFIMTTYLDERNLLIDKFVAAMDATLHNRVYRPVKMGMVA